MRVRLTLIVAIAAIASLAAATAALARTGRGSATTSLSVLGPYAGADQQSFQAVLSAFEAANPGSSVAFTSAGTKVGSTLSAAVKAGTPPDVAVLSLPAQSALLQSLVSSKGMKPIGFVAPSLDKQYAFTWKMLGTVDGGLYALPFKVNDESAFWYDSALFKHVGVQAPTTWAGLQQVAHSLLQAGIKPFAIAGGDGMSLGAIFANIYLTQQGPARYDALVAHKIKWTDPSVTAALREMAAIVRPGMLSRTIANAIKSDFPTTLMQLFRTPPRAAMLFGGSNVIPVLGTPAAVAARPSTQFGAFAFPTIAKPPARVVGSADVIVMLKDSPAARSLVDYLATPAAATVWAKRGGFLSPNAKVDVKSYPLAASRTMATQLMSTANFRLDLAGLMPATFPAKLNNLLQQYVRSPARVAAITKALEAAATAA